MEETNINSSKQNIVHILLMKDSISQQVYECVNQKKNFNDESFKQTTKPI